MNTFDKIVSLAKRRGIIFPGSEIYGGLGSAYDYGHYGVLLKNNIKAAWWHEYVLGRDDIIGLDAAILMNPLVWEASGHVSSFSDPLVECRSCHQRFRADHLFEGKYDLLPEKVPDQYNPRVIPEDISGKKEKQVQSEKNPERQSNRCPSCGGELTGEKKFNLMFKSHIGPAEESASVVYLRPETAQGIFVDYRTLLTAYRKKIPFGIAQIGKAFRNEITPGNFTFRTREFEQMEIEYFVEPGTDGKFFEYWKNERFGWYKRYGINPKHLRLREHAKEELSHYSRGTADVEYLYPWGWGELEGIANRGDYDLTQHQKFSRKDMEYVNDAEKKSFIPYVIEPSAGADRATLAFLMDAYREDGKRVILSLDPVLAPVKAAVFPLVANKPEIVVKARNVYESLKKQFYCEWDDRGNIGKRYFAQDEIGTPWCITIDYDTLKDDTVTVRDRDTAVQTRMKTGGLKDYFMKVMKNT